MSAQPRKHHRLTLTIITRQKVNSPVELIDWLGLASAQLRVEKMMIPNSIPYIRLRPNTSANHPKRTWPMTIPPLVEALRAWFTGDGSVPLFPPKPFAALDGGPDQKVSPRKVVTRLMAKMSYESRKKPTPATATARTSTP